MTVEEVREKRDILIKRIKKLTLIVERIDKFLFLNGEDKDSVLSKIEADLLNE